MIKMQTIMIKNCEHNVSQLWYSGQSPRSGERSECQTSKTIHNLKNCEHNWFQIEKDLFDKNADK